MLRLVALLLVLLNATYYLWAEGYLRPYGFAPQSQTEGFRLRQQIRPERVHVLSADEARQVEVAVQTPRNAPVCLQAGPLDQAQTVALRRAAQAVLPPGSWSLETAAEPARWIVYMGPYADPQALARKRSELSSLNLRFEPVTDPALGYGLSLGGFDTEAHADERLAALGRQGVHTARVVQERPASRGSVLRVPLVDEAMRARLDSLETALGEKSWHACT